MKTSFKNGKLRVAWQSAFSSSAMLKSSIFSETMLQELGEDRSLEIEVFSGDTPDSKTGFAEKSYSPLAAFYRHSESPFDVFFFQLEDRPECDFIPQQLALWPGVCLFHDVSLNSLFWHHHRHSTVGTDIDSELESEFGASAIKLGDAMVKGWPLEIYDTLQPTGRKIIGSADSLLCTSRCQQMRLLRMGSKLKLSSSDPQILPFPIAALRAEEIETERGVLRQMLELSHDNNVVAFSGGLSLKDGAAEMLETAAALRTLRKEDDGGLVLYWILPEDENSAAVDNFVRDYSARHALSLPEFRLLKASSGNEFAAFHSIADVFVSASTSTSHGPALGLLYAMARGRATIASGVSAVELADAEAALCFEPGRGQILSMARSAYAALAPELNRTLGESARSYVSENLEPRKSAAALKQIFEDAAGRSAEQLEAKRSKYSSVREELVSAAVNRREAPGVQESRLKILSRAAEAFSWRREERSK